MIVDFHVHSTASDGTFAPSELAAKAAKGGFAAIALTDHDNCDGVKEFLSALPLELEASTRLVPGIELSIEPGKGFHKFHLLGLGIDPENAALKNFLRRVLEGRNGRNTQIIANFNRIGIPMDESIYPYAHGDVLARPHFARWLMDRGYVKSIAEAFDTYLLPESPKETRCYEERYHPSREEALAVVHGAGGLAVMAHPKYWRRYWRDTGPEFDAARKGFAELKEMGLDGVESLYEANTMEENIGFTRLADEFGFLKTAGSDFHGANKPTIQLGMTVTESFIAPFLERLNGI